MQLIDRKYVHRYDIPVRAAHFPLSGLNAQSYPFESIYTYKYMYTYVHVWNRIG